MSTKQNTKSSDWKLSKLHLLLFKRADDGSTEQWRDEARKTELISSSHTRQLKRKKGRHFSFWKESFALACWKRASIVNIVQCRPWMRIWFWIWCTVFFLALAKQTKIGFRSIPKPMWQKLCDKKIGENVQMFKRKWNKLVTQHEDTFKNHGPILIFWREMWSMWLNLVFSKFLTTVISSDSSNWLLNFLLTTFCCFWNWLQFTAHLLLRFTKVVHLW